MNEITLNNQLETQIQAAIKKTATFVVASEKDLEQATDICKFIKEKIKQVESARKELVNPLNAHVDNINAKFKTLSDPLKKAEITIKSNMLSFQQKLEAERRAEEEAKRKELEEFTRKAAEEARAIGDIETAKEIDKATNIMINKPIELERVRGGATGAVSSITKRWKAKIINIEELAKARPDLIQPDMIAINKLVSAGVRDIAGVEIYQEENLAIR